MSFSHIISGIDCTLFTDAALFESKIRTYVFVKRDNLTMLAHIVCVAGIIVLSLSGSMFSIYDYSKKTLMSKASTFIISLAILDVFAMVVVVQIHFLLQYRHLREFHGYIWPRVVFRSTTRFVMVSYLLILTSIALDRVYAVYRPFACNHSSTYIIKLIIFELIFASLLSVIAKFIQELVFVFDDSYKRMFLMSVICISFSIILISYLLIVCKLRSQKTKVSTRH